MYFRCCRAVRALWLVGLPALAALPNCVSHSTSTPTVRGTGESALRAVADPSPGGATIAMPKTAPEEFLAHISLLAHNELGGRGVGSNGIDLAAGYIAGRFAAAGLLPGGPDGTYFQPFTIPSSHKLQDATQFSVRGRAKQPILLEDYVPFGFSAQGKFEGEVVFVGYGVSDPDHNYNDYGGVEVAGKVAFMLRREPPGFGEGGRYSNHATFESKMKLAAEKGAIAVLIANQEPAAGDIDTLTPFGGRAEPESIPALHVSRALANALVTGAGMPPLGDLQRALDERRENVSAALKGVVVDGRVAYESGDILTRNVIGVLPGLGPHADEYLVIGGHYDHLGIRRGEIYNGADDNASGTAGVIEVCRALAAAAYRDRSILCMTFAGEEKGLLGSAYFVKHPTVPLSAIESMINMDMIGRWNPDDESNKLQIGGLGTGASFQDIVARRIVESGIEYLPDPSALAPSDHATFYGAGIPSLFFFTGVHDDYHRPGDDTEKINAEGGARIAVLAARIALDLVNDQARPVFAKVDQPARIFKGTSVVMGVMPDMQDESGEPGWRIAAVMPAGGADKAGMRPGDRIIQIDGQAVGGMSDYRKVVATKKAGDVIAVTVRRGAEELILNVELASRL